ncbi:MAG: YccF domain-containing protein [Gammaproteobacteria bacterium]|jgi:uncharacterized membrane protein YccF (DUF307 family)
MLRLLGNIAWLILGGLVTAIAWWLAGLIMFLSVIGIPWGRACFTIGSFNLWPFGRRIVERDLVTGREDIGTGPFGVIGNIIWFLVGGFWLAVGHLIAALGCFVTLIGIPFGLQHLKMIELSMFPIGKTIAYIED